MKINTFKYFFKFKIITIILFFIISCQPVEKIEKVVFDNNILPKLIINANKKSINEIYEMNYVDPYIDHSLENPPLSRVKDYLTENINIFGTENKLVIKINDAQIIKDEIKNNDDKKFQEKTIYEYNINLAVEFLLYDDSEKLLATTIAESSRSTTSAKYISINEEERIVDGLILDALIDLTKKIDEMINKHMYQFML